MHKNNNGTPNLQIQLNKIKGYRRCFLKVRKTGGSMGPKIRAAIRFVENSGKDTIITKTTMLGIDNGGTRITLV